MRSDVSWLEEMIDMAELPAMYGELEDEVTEHLKKAFS